MFTLCENWGDDAEISSKATGIEENDQDENDTEEVVSEIKVKKISGHEKRRRQMKNKRRCKNKFKPQDQENVPIKKVKLEKVKEDEEDVKVDEKALKSEVSKQEPLKQESKSKKNKAKKLDVLKPDNKKSKKVDELEKNLVAKLKGSRFRYINEQLYTLDSKAAKKLFVEDPVAFEVYHQGFLSQVKKWPIKPLDLIIHWVKSKPKDLIVADFGCGEAFLAQKVPHKVHSFDLVALNKHVTVCDISHVPLSNESVDIVVCCLSLMNTNCQDFIVEANRVLKKNGVLKIAEVASRFKSIRMFVNDMKSVGFYLKKKDVSKTHFYMFEFTKSNSLKKKIGTLNGLQLSVCLYKKR